MDITAFCKVDMPNNFRLAKSVATVARFNVHYPSDRAAAFEESLKFCVIGPSKSEVSTGKELKNGVCELSFNCPESGDYLVGVGLGKQSQYVSVVLVDPLELMAEESVLEFVPPAASLVTLTPLSFTVVFPTRLAAKKAVIVRGPNGNEVELKKEVHVNGSIRGPNAAPMKMTCSFAPPLPGNYSLIATIDGKFHARGSPCEIVVEDALSNVMAEIKTIIGDGPILSNAPLVFKVQFPSALADVLNISVVDSDGQSVESCDGNELKEGLWECITSPLQHPGLFTISVSAGAHQLTTNVNVVPCESVFALQCRAEGAGLEDDKIAAFAKAPFRFYFPEQMPEEIIRITAVHENGSSVEMDGESLPGEPGCWICFFAPVSPGVHTISISCGDYPVPGFPKLVRIKDAKETFSDMIECDLRRDIATWDLRCDFRVSVPAAVPQEAVKVLVEYPSGTKVGCVRNEDDPEMWYFACGMPGQYQIDVLLNEEHIQGSPFVRHVVDPGVKFATECTVSGDGILSGMNTCGYATEFILSFPCPEEYLAISCVGPDGKPTLIDGSEIEDRPNCWRVEYLPAMEGEYTIGIMVGENHIPNSPFKVAVRPSIGGRGKLLVFFSSASGKKAAQRDLNRLEQIFLAKGLLEKDEIFEPFHAVDTWPREAREELFRIAGCRDLPQIWINDYYCGDVNKLQELEDEHVLSMLLEKMAEDAKKPKSPLEDEMLLSGSTGVKLGAAKAAVEGEKCLIQ